MATSTLFYLLTYFLYLKQNLKDILKYAVKNISPIPVPSHCVSLPNTALLYDCMCTQIHTHVSLL